MVLDSTTAHYLPSWLYYKKSERQTSQIEPPDRAPLAASNNKKFKMIIII
jgi:hypothetical protein